jgi:hypothetical protein
MFLTDTVPAHQAIPMARQQGFLPAMLRTFPRPQVLNPIETPVKHPTVQPRYSIHSTVVNSVLSRLTAGFVVALVRCAARADELTVLAAASLSDSLKEIAVIYEKKSGDRGVFGVTCEVKPEEGPHISYPMGVVEESRRIEAGKRFLRHLDSGEVERVCEKYGFIVRKQR